MEGDAGVVDPVSTVSSRIALLPANVCHVWHTRRGRPRACESGAGARMRTRALFSRVLRLLLRVATRESFL